MRVALFFGAEFFGVGFEAASCEFDGMLHVEHFVEEDVFDYVAGDAGAVEVAA